MTDPRPLTSDPRPLIKVLIVEDSPVVRELLVHILNSDTGIHVIETANNGKEAIKAVERNKPHVIVMDINMPLMNGFDASRIIMETNPVPIIIVTSIWNPKDIETSFRAMEAGVLAVLKKPTGIGHPDYEATAKELIQTVKLMSEVKVVRRWARSHLGKTSEINIQGSEIRDQEQMIEIKLIAIGASTGGPPVIQEILSGLPKDFPAPILIVQHMAEGFIEGFVEWLNYSSKCPVHVASANEYILPGHVYVSPSGFHMGVKIGNRIALSKCVNENNLCPSVSYLFRSVAEVFGRNAVGVLLTGMGKDGAEELKIMKEKGAVTIVQNKESSIIYGMPGEAIKLDAASYVFSPDKIAAALVNIVKKKR